MSVLAVGIATLDIINEVENFPKEDTEHRAISQRICRGGNATNTLVVLSQLGHQCTWAGNISSDPSADPILNELQQYQIQRQYTRTVANSTSPTSYITLNRSNGSRTIVHYRHLPEYIYHDFQKINLADFDWLHFEGRAIDETLSMLKQAKTHFPNKPISLEVEKHRDNIDTLFPHADIILFSKPYALQQGYQTATEFLNTVQQSTTHNATLICTWGDQGAYAMTQEGDFIHTPALKLQAVVDTIGAGDTFNAAIIDARLRHQNWVTTLQQACYLAGKKCQQQGFANLVLKSC